VTKNYTSYFKKITPLIGILLLVYIISTLDLNKIKELIFSINPLALILVIGISIIWLILRNYVWQIIQKEQKIDIPFWTSLKIFVIGHFYCTFTPGYLGHVMRVPYMKEKTNQPYGKLFVNILIEASIRTLAIFCLFFIGSLLLLSMFPHIFTIGFVIFLIMIITLFYFMKKERGEKVFYFFIKNLIPKKYKEKFYSFVDTFYQDFPKTNKLIIPFILSFFIWIIIFTQEYLLAYLIGVNIPYFSFIFLFPIANLAGYIPLTFGGLGFREFTSILIFTTLFSVSREEIFLFTILGYLLLDILTGVVGFTLSLSEFDNSAKKISIID